MDSQRLTVLVLTPSKVAASAEDTPHASAILKNARETCIIDIAVPWYWHSDASYVQRIEAPERDIDSELLAGGVRRRRTRSRNRHEAGADAPVYVVTSRGYRKSRHEWANMG